MIEGDLVDFRELLYVLTIEEEKSFSNAAKKLFMAQPSLSQYIKRLEGSLGFLLFKRSHTPLTLTDEGKQYVDYAKRILILKEEMQRVLEEVANAERGSISLGIPSIRGSYLLPMMIPFFKYRHPKIEVTPVEVMAGGSDELEKWLSEGKLDLCILSHPISRNDLEYEMIFEEEILLAVPPSNKTISSEQAIKHNASHLLYLKELKGQPFILTTNQTRLRKAIERVLAEANFSPRIIMETNSLETAQKMVSVGYGCTFVPEMFMRAPYERHCPTYQSVQESDYRWPLLIAHRKGGYLSKATKTFLGDIKLYCRDYLRSELIHAIGSVCNENMCE